MGKWYLNVDTGVTHEVDEGSFSHEIMEKDFRTFRPVDGPDQADQINVDDHKEEVEDILNTMERKDLAEMAESLGLRVASKDTAATLRTKIRNAQ